MNDFRPIGESARQDDLETLRRRSIIRYVTNFDHMIAAINPKLDPKRRTTRAALAATQIEGLMILLARGRPRHAYLVGIERECVAQILRLAKQP